MDNVLRLTLIRNDAEMLTVLAPSATPEPLKCACIAQAITAACGSRSYKLGAINSIEVVSPKGALLPREEWPKCRVHRSDWTWPLHGWTHEFAKPLFDDPTRWIGEDA